MVEERKQLEMLELNQPTVRQTRMNQRKITEPKFTNCSQ